MKVKTAILVLPSMLIFTQACSQMTALQLTALDSPSTGTTPTTQVIASGGDGLIQLSFKQPTSQTIVQSMTVEITATPMEQLRGIRLSINGTNVKNFTRLPFVYSFNSSTYPGDQIEIRAESEDQSGKTNFVTTTLLKPATTTTVPGTGPQTFESSKDSGVVDPNCLNNPNFDACLFWKNPVAHRNAPLSTMLRFGADLTDTQTFGVKLEGLSNPTKLANASFRVTTSEGAEVMLQNGRMMQAYNTDQSNHVTAQLMAYFWLNYQITATEARSGVFYAKGKNIPVNAYDPRVPGNAYWDGGSEEIVLGVNASGSTKLHEMALSAEVFLHEMGHANYQYAVGGFAQTNPSSSTERCTQQGGCVCLSDQGCSGAINEGQADFHYLMLFKEAPPLAETITNTLAGWSNRNVVNNAGVSVSSEFQRSRGEVHGMGAIYASIIWSIYDNPAVNKREFEKIFMTHLPALTNSSRFPESREALLAQDQVLFNGKYQSIITDAFQSRGVN